MVNATKAVSETETIEERLDRMEESMAVITACLLKLCTPINGKPGMVEALRGNLNNADVSKADEFVAGYAKKFYSTF